MKSAYIAICYACNERCRFCPCTASEKKEKKYIDFSEIKNIVDSLSKDDFDNITISGGEPTLHSDFIGIVRYIQHKNINVTVLSNSERFSNKYFIEQMEKNIQMTQLRVITTLHSYIEEHHQFANCTPGSFKRTLAGLRNLIGCGVKVTIKHCITKENYMELPEFYDFCKYYFESDIDIQFCSIDYCGMTSEQAKTEMLSFYDLKPYLERTFDKNVEDIKCGDKRRLYCINMPLCACDVYYWNYLSKRTEKMYDGYTDPNKKTVKKISDNVGVLHEVCKDCKVMDICQGTYITAFKRFGSKIVRPYI